MLVLPFSPHTLPDKPLYDYLKPMANKLTENCTTEVQLDKIIKGQERKFRWRDDWPTMEKELQESGAAAIAAHNESHNAKTVSPE
jgi:hypothetical protein